MCMEDIMKKILFVINTMGIGGGERGILELFDQIDSEKYEVSLFVLTGQGELIGQIPDKVHLLNTTYFPISVLDHSGKIRLIRTVIRSMFIRGTICKRMKYIVRNLREMTKKGKIQKDKLLWKVLSDGAQRLEQEYDLAVAYLEGGSAYYVASYVKARKKAAFIHINYELAGYSRELDEDCYIEFDRIFPVSESVKESFLTFYPECRDRTDVFYNLINRDKIMRKAEEEGGFSDGYNGFRILTVGRLVPQKALPVAIDAMKILKAADRAFRWYVLGECDSRKKLQEQIQMLGLEEDFILLGTVENPYPYYAQCDLYVHTTYYEGKSIAIEEAQILGCAMLVSEHSGVREQIEDGVDGKICALNPQDIAKNILEMAQDQKKLACYRHAAAERRQTDNQREASKLLELLK